MTGLENSMIHVTCVIPELDVSKSISSYEHVVIIHVVPDGGRETTIVPIRIPRRTLVLKIK